MSWFKKVFGFAEAEFATTRKKFSLEEDGLVLVSKPSGQRFHIGSFECPSLEELRKRVSRPAKSQTGLTFRNLAGDARKLHQDPDSAGAVFQVASQFNCLEMPGPETKPEDGVAGYVHDRTQGPVCAMCCPAALIFRNYLVNERGQAGHNQLDLLSDVAKAVHNEWNDYWTMKNGYCMPQTTRSMAELGGRLSGDEVLSASVKDKLRVGIHWSTEVANCGHQVCQVYCSALPVSYISNVPAKDWTPFACAVLDSAYESTLLAAAVLAAERAERVTVYLTALGGGCFGNCEEWIASAIKKSIQKHRALPLDVRLVHFMAPGALPPPVFHLLEKHFKKSPVARKRSADTKKPKKRPAAVVERPGRKKPRRRPTAVVKTPARKVRP